MSHREIVAPVSLCTAEGLLDAAAVGWSRTPRHRCNLRGPALRVKKWNHWCVRDERAVATVTVADVGYLGVVVVMLRDLVRDRDVRRVAVIPGAIGVRLGERVDDEVTRASRCVDVRTVERDDATVIRTRAWRMEAELVVDRDPNVESLNVVVPWSDRAFQFTSKHVARRARGWVRVGGERWTFGGDAPAFACLDFGRGVWPYRTHWQWAAAAGVEDGTTMGLNLGGTWTDRTGATENALWIDGRIHKIDQRVRFDVRRDRRSSWTIRSEPAGRVDLVFEPTSALDAHLPLGVISSRLTMRFGRFSGTIVDDAGRPIHIRALEGWAEDHVARW
jgi:hypothetical protein